MKDACKQFERAADDVAKRIEKLLSDLRPMLTTRYQMSDEVVSAAFSSAAATVSLKYSEQLGVTSESEAETIRELAPSITEAI